MGRDVNTAKALQRAKLVQPAIDAARSDGHTSLRKIAERLNEQSITTPRGRDWTPTAVRNTLALLARPTDTAHAPRRHK